MKAQTNIARVAFTISSAGGTLMYAEGAVVPAEIAAKFPKYLVGYVPKASEIPVAHDPSLHEKLTPALLESYSDDRIIAWFKQFHPGKEPKSKMERDALIQLVKEVQGE